MLYKGGHQIFLFAYYSFAMKQESNLHIISQRTVFLMVQCDINCLPDILQYYTNSKDPATDSIPNLQLHFG